MINSLYDKFKPWSDKRSIWMISDTHFDDEDCKLMDARWLTPFDHIGIINSKLKGDTTLIHLGDVGEPSYIEQIRAKYKILITGNHDAGVTKYKKYFDEIYTGPLIIGEKLILSHEPVDVPWAFNIHGHDHNYSHKGDCYHLNICSNVVHFFPVNLGQIIKNGLMRDITSIHRITIDEASGINEG